MIDFNMYYVARLLLPTFLRRPKMLAWMNSLLAPLAFLNERWKSLDKDIKSLQLPYCSQLVAQEKINVVFDPKHKRIRVNDDRVLPLSCIIVLPNELFERQQEIEDRLRSWVVPGVQVLARVD